MNEMKNKKHHTMETIPKWPEKNTTLWEQFQNEKKIYHNMETIP
jgi:hypothetical protein